MADFRFDDHGSVCILTALSPEGRAWADEHLPDDAQRWVGGVVISPRYAGDVLHRIIKTGLTQEG